MQKRILILLGLCIFIIVMLFRSCSFDGRFTRMERKIRKSDELVFTMSNYKMPTDYNQFKLRIAPSKLSIKKAGSQNTKSFTEIEDVEYDRMIQRDLQTLRRRQFKYNPDVFTKYIKYYQTGYLNGVEFTYCANEYKEVVCVLTKGNNKMESDYYFRNGELISNFRRQMKVQGTHMIGMDYSIDWKTKRSYCYFANDEVRKSDSPSFWEFNNQRLKTGYYYKAIAESIINHDSLNCIGTLARFPTGNSEFENYILSNLTEGLKDSLLALEARFEIGIDVIIDSSGSSTNIRCLRQDHELTSLRLAIENEMTNLIEEITWIPATYRCGPISSERRIVLENDPRNKKSTRFGLKPLMCSLN